MFEKQISQSLQDAIKKITSVSEALVGNQHKIDKNKNGKIDAHDFKLLKGQKAAPMKEDSDWVIIEQDEDNTTAKVAGHKVTLHRSLSEPGMSDTYTLHHPSGAKKVKISFDTHGDGYEVHGDKVNHAFGLDSKHKLGHKIAGSMNGMGGVSKFNEGVDHIEEVEIGEARKLEGTYSHTNGNQSKVYKLSGEHHEGDPYHVKLFKAGKHYEPADYFTNDKEDAHGTAKHMVKEESHQAATTMKHIPNASPALKKAAKDIKPGIAGYRDRIDMLKAGGVKEEVEEQVDETIVKHDDFTVEIKESYTFADYLTAAKQLVGEEEAVAYANEAFKTQDLTIFIMEEMSRGDIEDNINAHRKAGHTVTMPKYSTKDGKPHAEYTVTDKDEGTRRKYIHHGNVRKVENMGAKS